MLNKNVVIFGQSGVGKSSLINMLCSGADAPTSNDATGCTITENCYKCEIASKSYKVHDTIGLEEGRWGFLSDPEAQKRLKAYLKNTNPDLLIYCMSGRGGLNKSHGRNYRKFALVVGKTVPVAVVVTNLERFTHALENWWEMNKDVLGRIGIPYTAPHACITTLPKADLEPDKKDLYDKSRSSVEGLIKAILP